MAHRVAVPQELLIGSSLTATQAATATILRCLHTLVAAPEIVFLATLAAMLFRPPDLPFHSLDRIAFLLLSSVVGLKILLERQPFQIPILVTWPMFGLLLLGFFSLLSQPYDPQNWSVFAAKWAVPFAFYEISGLVFQDAASLRRLELFLLAVLGYLSLVAVLFLLDASQFVLPPYIVNEHLGIHADRARGPFLQAVANGVTLNMLALIGLDSFRRRRLGGLPALFFFVGVPLAIVATKTRAVWLSFAGSVAWLVICSNVRVRRPCIFLILAGTVVTLLGRTFADANTSLSSRLEDSSPVEFRLVIYQTALDMFREKPFLGWNSNQVQPELAKRIYDFHQTAFFFHNTYLEIAVAHGLFGVLFYAWLILDLFRVGRSCRPHLPNQEGGFLDEGFRSIWPVLLAVYLLNASFVVMNYQFVNALLFTIAGLLSAQNHTARARLQAFRD